MRSLALCGIALVGLLGCGGGSSGPQLLRDDIPEPPEGGVQLVGPIFEVPAQTEAFYCMRVPFESDEPMYVIQSASYQVSGGHHVMLWYSDTSPPSGDAPHECDDGDMGNLRLIGVGSAEGGGIATPDGIAMKIPAGVKIYTQSHYLNLGDSAMQAQDVTNLTLIPESAVEQLAGSFTQVDLTLDLAPGQETTRTVDCTAPMDMAVPWMLPHMHELGVHFTLELLRGDQVTTLYDETWDPSFRDHFPIVDFDPHLQLSTSDRLRTTCTWQNDGLERRLFPSEMCATFMLFYPSPDGTMWACDETGDHFQP